MGMDYENYFVPADEEHVKREKAKARDLRNSQWWKNELAKGRCHYCGNRFHPRDLTMDHIVPLSKGGLHTKENITTACMSCNSGKKDKSKEEYERIKKSFQPS